MADITKIVNRAVPPAERTLTLTDTDLADGDVFRVYESLGRAAESVTVTVAGGGAGLQLKLNSRIKIYPRRKYPEQERFGWTDSEVNLAQGVEVQTDVTFINFGARAAGVYVISDVPIRDIEIDRTGAGTFSITVS